MTQRKIAEHPHQIAERVAEFVKDGDMEGVLSMFHPDCRVAMDPDGAPMEGHDGVRQIFQDFVANRLILKPSVSGEMINGDTALLQGEWTIEDHDGNIVGGGVSTEVTKRMDHGGWTYFIDCPLRVPKPVCS
ncbi:nuclear transport factor 2 family protein [Tateyamaria sp. ANG-S1]|uniref:YybH family protein n=1 Tax=Tateyamaria sp. ANG-S1 TaxID=1577905 RepID=UPI0006924145|nr:nuclear transport factor 2 family protein [Tateyamaria sp. ANG-S1]